MTTSFSTNYPATANDIIVRALRICSAIGQGETPYTTQINEALVTFNHVVKKFQGDGMQLWKRSTSFFTPTASTGSYAIGPGFLLSQQAPTKVLQAWYRNNSTGADTPMLIITRQEYDTYSNKSTTGTPNLLYYDPPGAINSGQDMQGTFYLLPVPDSSFANGFKIYFTALFGVYDLDNTSDNVDFPSFYFNALVWALAADLAYDYGVPLSERAMISKKADAEREAALANDIEEGSLFLQPDPIAYNNR